MTDRLIDWWSVNRDQASRRYREVFDEDGNKVTPLSFVECDAVAFRDALAEGLVAAGISERGNPAQRDASHLIGWLITEGYRVSHINGEGNNHE